MTFATFKKKLRAAIRAAEAEQATHKRKWGDCLSSCETVQLLSALYTVAEMANMRMTT